MDAVRGQKQYNKRTLWHSNSMFGPSHSAISRILKQDRKFWFLFNTYEIIVINFVLIICIPLHTNFILIKSLFSDNFYFTSSNFKKTSKQYGAQRFWEKCLSHRKVFSINVHCESLELCRQSLHTVRKCLFSLYYYCCLGFSIKSGMREESGKQASFILFYSRKYKSNKNILILY